MWVPCVNHRSPGLSRGKSASPFLRLRRRAYRAGSLLNPGATNTSWSGLAPPKSQFPSREDTKAASSMCGSVCSQFLLALESLQFTVITVPSPPHSHQSQWAKPGLSYRAKRTRGGRDHNQVTVASSPIPHPTPRPVA